MIYTTKQRYILITVISLIYLVYVSAFVKPWRFNNFSLVDDGQVLVQSTHFLKDCLGGRGCAKFIDQTFEFGTNRFRPSYWAINNTLYLVIGNNPVYHHIFRVYFVGLATVLLLVVILMGLSVSLPLITIASVFYFTSFSFSENIIRLGTNEPYQVLFLALFSIIFLRDRKSKNPKYSRLWLMALLVFTLLIKENNIAVLPVLVIIELLYNRSRFLKKREYWLALLPLTVLLTGIIISKLIPSEISNQIPIYTSNYVTNPLLILENTFATLRLVLNSTSPFVKLCMLVLPLIFLSSEARHRLRDRPFVYWSLFTFLFVAILFPWKHVLARYHLVGFFSLTIVLFYIFDIFQSIARKKLTAQKVNGTYTIFYDFTVFVIFANLLFIGLPVNLAKTINYREWFETFTRFEADQVSVLAGVSGKGKIYLNAHTNINNWEYLYEIPIHLKYLYGVNTVPELIDPKALSGGYLLTRSSLDTVLSEQDLAKLEKEEISRRTYELSQIDPLMFRQKFMTRPVDTVVSPPLQETGFEYSWAFYKI